MEVDVSGEGRSRNVCDNRVSPNSWMRRRVLPEKPAVDVVIDHHQLNRHRKPWPESTARATENATMPDGDASTSQDVVRDSLKSATHTAGAEIYQSARVARASDNLRSSECVVPHRHGVSASSSSRQFAGDEITRCCLLSKMLTSEVS